MSQTVREIAMKYTNPVLSGWNGMDDITPDEIKQLAAQVLTSTEPRESLDGLGRRIKELTEVIADLRDQLRAATMRAQAAEGDTRIMDELQAKCGALLMEVAAATKERDEARQALARQEEVKENMLSGLEAYERQVLSLEQLAGERGREVERVKGFVRQIFGPKYDSELAAMTTPAATPPEQEHPDTETRAEMLDRIADEESEALMPGGFNG